MTQLATDEKIANHVRHLAVTKGKLISAPGGMGASTSLSLIIGSLISLTACLVGYYKFEIHDQFFLHVFISIAALAGIVSGFFIVGHFVVTDPTIEMRGIPVRARKVTLEPDDLEA